MKKMLINVVLLLAIALTACNPAKPASPGTDATTGSSAQGKVTIRMWSYLNPAWNKANETLIKQFMAENPDIEVKYETFDYDTFIQNLQTSMAAGTEADVIELFGTWTCSYARGGRLLEVPAEIMTYEQAQNLYFAAPLSGYYCDNKLYGLPNEFNLENGGALINLDLFARAGIPTPPQWKTFDDLRADAKKLTQVDQGTMKVAGFHYTNGDGMAFTFLAGILQQGGKYFAEDGKHFNFDTPEARNIAQLMVDMAQKDKIIDPIIFNNSADTIQTGFFGGRVAIGFIGSYAAAEGLTNYPDIKLDYVAIPPYFGDKQVYAADSGWGKVVSKNTKNPEAAWKLAKYLTTDPTRALEFAKTSTTIPAIKSLVDQPDQLLQGEPFLKNILPILANGQYIGDVTDRDQLFYEIIYPTLLQAIQGSITVDEAVTQINKDANAMVDAKQQ